VIPPMLLREVEYARPSSVEEAIGLLAGHEGARALAGGQTIVNVMKARAASPDVLVDLNGLDELRAISVSGDTLRLGAMATYTQLMGSSEVDVSRPILAEVAAQIADVQVRNRGTIGGNVCSNDPTNHLPPLLVALGASMTIRGEGGERTVSADEFFLGVYMTAVGGGDRHLRTDGDHQRRQVVRRVVRADVAADRAAIAYLHVGDLGRHLGDHRTRLRDLGGRDQLRAGRHRADLERAVAAATNRPQLVESVEVDEHVG